MMRNVKEKSLNEPKSQGRMGGAYLHMAPVCQVFAKVLVQSTTEVVFTRGRFFFFTVFDPFSIFYWIF